MTPSTTHLREVLTEVLLLRAFSDDDAELIGRSFADPDTARWNGGLGTDRQAVLEWLERRNDWTDGAHVSWAVAEPAGALLGSVSVFGIDWDQSVAEIGYWTGPWARRRGIAAAAVQTATRVGFLELGLHRIRLHHAVENVGSCAVATRTDYALEGVLRHSYRYADGLYHDEHLHARLSALSGPS